VNQWTYPAGNED
jgi:hypothetical protein